MAYTDNVLLKGIDLKRMCNGCNFNFVNMWTCSLSTKLS